MNKFNNDLHTITLSNDGTYTAYSKEYDEHYHSTKDGALSESLFKHVIPTLKIQHNKKEVNILDICFGLGFNTLSCIYYCKKNKLDVKLNIYSPELDSDLINSLNDFTYPEEFLKLKHIIKSLVQNSTYKDDNIYIELFVGDARGYIKKFNNFFDIVYQDAFSPTTNPTLWTKQYFYDIKKAMKKDGVLSTYSTAIRTRLALYENDFNIYLNVGENFRNATIASFVKLENFKEVDMLHKISCNKDISPLMD
jgi:tRNA U34 5-methylaminomethyl-2-thiouridine-forming methyltransferase MnmC